MKATQGLLEFPNQFEYGPPKKLAVFCFVSMIHNYLFVCYNCVTLTAYTLIFTFVVYLLISSVANHWKEM